jgi:dolichol-phosphate mannosyltransferase
LSKKHKVLAVIPTYKERENLKTLIPAVLRQDERLEVLVVDDASPDGTAREALRQEHRHPGRVHLLKRESKMGLGTAYVTGFSWGLEKGYGTLVQMDADWSHDPRYLPDFIKALRGHDVVLGSRYLGGRVSVVNWPLSRLFLSTGANLYVRLITGLPFSDSTGGFKAFRAGVLRHIGMEAVRSDGYSFQIEMNYKAYKKGYRFTEIPIIFNDRTSGTSKMSGHIVREAIWRVWTLRLGF